MEDSDDSNREDVWSPTLREDVFSNHDMMGNSWSGEPRHRLEHLPLPNFNSIGQPLNHMNWPNPQSHQHHRSHNNIPPTKSSSSSSRTPLSSSSVNRSRSHLDDLPNFPLQAVCLLWSTYPPSRTVLEIRNSPGVNDYQYPLELPCCLDRCQEERC